MTDGFTVMTGAASWQADEWLKSFYPEDLPPEWQMSYYANEFSTTLLGSQVWRDPEQLQHLAEMLEDCHEAFHPVLSIQHGQATPQQVSHFFQWLAKLDGDIGIRRMAGVLLSPGEEDPVQPVLREWRECIPEGLPIALQGDVRFDGANRQWLADHRMSPVWTMNQPTVENIGYWLCDVTLMGDSRSLATQVGEFLAVSSGNRSVCIIATSGYEDIAKLNELSTIVRLITG